MLKYLTLFFFFTLSAGQIPLRAQEAMQTVTVQAAEQRPVAGATAGQVEMADTLRQDGKIYIVVIVLLTVLAGVLFYLIRLDQKVSRLEKELRS
ncbi:hypothetical protein BH24BAC1_BH24BAC1_24000 [soil metagenome]